jgi:hypothetical protein
VKGRNYTHQEGLNILSWGYKGLRDDEWDKQDPVQPQNQPPPAAMPSPAIELQQYLATMKPGDRVPVVATSVQYSEYLRGGYGYGY